LPAINERMGEFLEDGGVLADLYAGVGTHGIALRRKFRRVWFAEGSRSAVADLKATARAHGMKDFVVSPVSVERGLQRLADERPDAIVLNPSRAGAVEDVLRTIVDTPAKQLAYLSCDPQTLCRDVNYLAEAGFEVRSVQPVDMMPQTRQVEALALLTRSNPKPSRKTGAPGGHPGNRSGGRTGRGPSGSARPTDRSRSRPKRSPQATPRRRRGR
jgi:tRNA/tmRNA/rRNA uracil-C5-methylase (TrmA/RlmC/RlmD family)